MGPKMTRKTTGRMKPIMKTLIRQRLVTATSSVGPGGYKTTLYFRAKKVS